MTRAHSRRTILAGIAAAPAIGTAALAVQSVDPIFAVVERHRLAHDAFQAAAKAGTELERELPLERRRSRVFGFGNEIHETDDPRWIANERATQAASDAADAAACDLLAVRPTTLAGVAALLREAFDYEWKGNEWPDRMGDDDDHYLTWHAWMFKHAADTLEGLAVQS